MADSLGVETFAINLEERYGLDLTKIEEHDVTLGTLFRMTRNSNSEMQFLLSAN